MKIEKNNLFTFGELTEKERRNLEILALVAKKGLVSRTELSRETGINIVSISNYIKNHIEKNLVFDAGLDVSTGGRKPELVEINNKDNCVAGLDAGSDRIEVVITDLAAKKITGSSITRAGSAGDIPAAILSAIKGLVSGLSLPDSALRAIGVSSRDNGMKALAKDLEARSGVPVFAAGKAICAAYGERRLNKDADTEKMLYMHTDLGRGVMIIKDEFIGAGEAEIGELQESARYLTAWDEALGVVGSAKKEVGKGIGTSIVRLSGADAEKITEEIVIDAAKGRDEVAFIILQNVAINLGLRISYLVNLFSPHTVVIGGGIERAGDIVMPTVKKMVDRLAFAKQAKAVSIIPGVLGNDASGLGAAALAVREIFLNA